MTYLVSITSQGQISIPASFRKALNLSKFKKAFATLSDSKIIIEPISDLLDLEGTLKGKVKKIPFIKALKLEKKALSESLKDKYHK